MRDFSLDDIKKLIDDPFTYDPTGDTFLDSRYNEPQNKTHLYYCLFYRLATFLQPDFTVELGGWQGTAAAHLAEGWPLGAVATIDHHTDPGDEWNKVRMIEAAEKYDNLHYIQGWTNNVLAERERGNHTLGNAPSAFPKVVGFEKKIDILFIDSWHRYQEAMMDWEVYKPLLASPSLVICDDIHPAFSGMVLFWNKLPGEKFLNSTLHPGYPTGFLKYE